LSLQPTICISANHYIACQQLWPLIFEAFVREIGLYGLSGSSSLSTARVEVLLDGLVSTKNFLDTFLKIPPDRLVGLTSAQWSLLHYSILLVAAVSVSAQTPIWNIGLARSIIKLEVYLDAVSASVKKVASSMSVEDGHNSWYEGLLRRLEAIKISYMMALPRSRADMTMPTAVAQSRTLQDMDVLSCQIPDAQAWQDPGQCQALEAIFAPMAGFELLDFPNIDSWMLPTAEPSTDGIFLSARHLSGGSLN
jgi:hypothetical protein